MNIKSILDGIKCFIENPKSYELLYSKNDEIHNEYALSEREGELLLEYITKLQNNWNELKEYCLNEQIPEEYDEYNSYVEFSNNVYENILEKMQELEGMNGQESKNVK